MRLKNGKKICYLDLEKGIRKETIHLYHGHQTCSNSN